MEHENIRIRVHEHYGENLLTPEEGERLLGEIQPRLADRNSVMVDFVNVRIVTSAFLNAAIGRLYGSFSNEYIREHLSVKNLSDIALFTLKRVVENSKAYYESEQYRGAVDAAAHSALEA